MSSRWVRACKGCGARFQSGGRQTECSLACYLDVRTERTETCWAWRGPLWLPAQYGRASYGGRKQFAHRAMYERFRGPIGDRDACHSCDNPLCVNPEHIFLGTQAQNNTDRDAKGRAAKGERNARSKLDTAAVIAIRADDRSDCAIGRAYGVSNSAVRDIRLRRTWKHVE